MTPKRLIQTYKPPHRWVNSPPGIGDFVRGSCYLLEMLAGSGIELRIDISQTEFFELIEQDPTVFWQGDPTRIGQAEEYFVDHLALYHRLKDFFHSNEPELYLCTNVGEWDRTTLPDETRAFIRQFYRFRNDLEESIQESLGQIDYEVLSIRCGDPYYKDLTLDVPDPLRSQIFTIIENHILPWARHPIAITSDCHPFKLELARKYRFGMLPHRSQHGAFGHARPVAMDLCMLSKSRFNYLINAWTDWWPGFSHYTSLIFQIPSLNFRSPNFAPEEVGRG